MLQVSGENGYKENEEDEVNGRLSRIVKLIISYKIVSKILKGR